MASLTDGMVAPQESSKGILYLSQDLFPSITSQLSQSDKSRLALACRDLYGCVNPLLYDDDRVRGDNHALWWACHKNKMGTLVKVILRNKAVVNYHFREMHSLPGKDLNGSGKHTTPLVVALRAGHNRIVAALVSSGADVNLPDNNPALHHTRCWYPINWVVDNAKVGQQPEKAIEYLHSRGADMNKFPLDSCTNTIHKIEDKKGEYEGDQLLKYAGDSAPIFRALSLAPPETTEAKQRICTAFDFNKDLQKLLDLRLRQVAALLKAGADPNIRDPATGHTPLFHILITLARYQPSFYFNIRLADRGEKDAQLCEIVMPYVLSFMQELVNWGANVNVSCKGRVTSTSDLEELTPLHIACGLHEHNEPLVDFLLEFGADINACAENGRTPLYRCRYAFFKDLDVLKRLMQKGTERNQNLNHQDNLGQTILHLLCSDFVCPLHRLESTIRLLVSRGADASIRDHSGRTAAELATHMIATDYDRVIQALNPIKGLEARRKKNTNIKKGGRRKRFSRSTNGH
ncbi:ankyrin repeat-containing domain protein [Whalleya microplaca]|nr:ankyrin repeat-containing domain protein [Whalleya microplaca]